MQTDSRGRALEAVGMRVSRKLESLLGAARAEETAREILAELSLDALRDPGDCYRFGELLRRRGGPLKVLGCSLQSQALIQGAIPDLAPSAEASSRVDPERHVVAGELDVSRVRTRAHEIARALGGSALAAQRIATATSELARNIVAYAGSGWVEIIPSAKRSSLKLRATDRGPGISDLELVLSGKYRSRTGLGRGLAGVRRLATSFEVDTGPTGTRVDADFALI